MATTIIQSTKPDTATTDDDGILTLGDSSPEEAARLEADIAEAEAGYTAGQPPKTGIRHGRPFTVGDTAATVTVQTRLDAARAQWLAYTKAHYATASEALRGLMNGPT